MRVLVFFILQLKEYNIYAPLSPFTHYYIIHCLRSDSMSYELQLAAAKKATCLAAHLCQKVRITLLQSDVLSKFDKSPVTVADYGSQVLISLVLERELPLMPFSLVAEEDSRDLSKETLSRVTKLVNETLLIASEHDNSNIIDIATPLSEEDVLVIIDKGKSQGGPEGQHWVLDPIDGTKGYLRRGDHHQYAIALALLDQGKVVLGVLACPNLPMASVSTYDYSISEQDCYKVGCLFFAQSGGGTYMQSLLHGSLPTKIHVTNVENAEEASCFESYEVTRSSHHKIAKKLGVKAPLVRIDSQAKYCALSRGDGTIYMRFTKKGYREKIWDHAAGYIIVVEAGGIVVDAAGKPLDFSKGRYLDLDTGIVVANQQLMPALLKAVQESAKETSLF